MSRVAAAAGRSPKELGGCVDESIDGQWIINGGAESQDSTDRQGDDNQYPCTLRGRITSRGGLAE